MSWKQLAVTGLVILFAIVIWLSHEVWFAAFLGVMLALSLTGPARWIRDHARMPAWLATLVVLVVVLVVLAGLGWLIGAPMTSQLQDMAAKLPDATEKAVNWLDQRAWGRMILQQLGDWSGLSQEQIKDADEFFGLDAEGFAGSGVRPDVVQPFVDSSPPLGGEQGTGRDTLANEVPASSEPSGTLGAGQILEPLGAMLAATLHAATLAVVSVVVALFLAFDPHMYERGVLWLIPRRHETIARKTMQRLSTALRWWMLGRLASMAAVGILTSLGMWAIGMPAPMALGALAGLLSFVPNVGPIVSAVPGLILAVPLGPWMILGAAGVYLGAQLVESNAINPLITQYAVAVPPGLLIVTQLIMATLAGMWGLIIATPLLVVAMTLVQQLYIREGLKEPIEVTGTKQD